MKTFYGNTNFKNLNTMSNSNNQNIKLHQKYEHYNENINNIKEQNSQNQIINQKIKNNKLNFKNKLNQPTIIKNPMTFPQNRRFNYNKNLNPANMQFNNEVNLPIKIKQFVNKNYFRNKNNDNINNKNYININQNYININKNYNITNSNSMSKNNNIKREYSKKKMGQSQMNFYNHNNNLNYFPNINNQRQNLNSISGNWMIYSHQQQKLYNDFINNMVKNNPQKFGKENFIQVFDFEYKRPEEKLKKGQNQLILERLQKKYATQIKERNNNFHRTGTGFYQKKNNNKEIGKGRQFSAQENIGDSFKLTNDNKIDDKNQEKMNIKGNKVKELIDINENKNEKMFNKTFNGFNLKKKNKEKRKKEKKILKKIINYFNKKANYFWVKYFNKKRKKRNESEEENFKQNKSFDNNNLLLFQKIIKKYIKIKLMFTKKIYKKKDEIKYNTDNSEIDEVKEYKKYFKNDYANFIKSKRHSKEDDKNQSSSESEHSNLNKNEPKFKGIFDNDKNENYVNKERDEKRRFNFKTTSNFFNKNNFNNNYSNNNNQETRHTDKTNSKEEGKKYKDDFDKEKKNKFIENIINNVIENNKRAAAARSSTSFYNIGSHFMNNHMRSTKTKFYNPKENKGGGFTGTKDSNFTKEQANEGKFFMPNSLKITLINPINWRKHEEIWDNLVTLNMGISELEKYLMPPNETDVLISSYLKMNPRILNFCSLQKINTSNTKNENNFISFMIDDNIQNPKQEIKKWKEAYKRVIFRWHPDKLFSTLEEIKLKNEQQKTELKKKSTLIINSTNSLYKNIMEILNKILMAKNIQENNN